MIRLQKQFSMDIRLPDFGTTNKIDIMEMRGELSQNFVQKNKDVKTRLADFGIIGRLKYIVTLELMRIEKSISCDSQCGSIHCLYLGLGE